MGQVSINVDIKPDLYAVLKWYAQYTMYWVSNDYEKQAVDQLINESIRSFLEAELNSGFTYAQDMLKEEFRNQGFE